MLDFTELSADGQDLELLVREILFRQGFSVHWSGRGADGGRDLICIERRGSFFQDDQRSWLIQCKHNAHSGRSVGIGDLDEISDSCAHHGCHGYLLVCSTYPSSAVVNRLEGISSSAHSATIATYWDSVKIERILSTPSNWTLAQRFFPLSAAKEGWQIYATEMPNQWVVAYQGYYFHLRNRVGSTCDYHLESVKARVRDIEGIALPEKHSLRPRSVYYDDKNCNYEWYIDYMYPSSDRPIIGSAEIADALGDGYALEDGQGYTFDIKLHSYLECSDHHDLDHYSYYSLGEIPRNGGARINRTHKDYIEAEESKKKLDDAAAQERSKGFDRFREELEKLPFLSLVRSSNSRIEDLDKFYIQRNWSEIIEKFDIDNDRFFSAWFFIRVRDDRAFHELVSRFHQGIERNFRLTRAHTYFPSDDYKGSVRDGSDDLLYELTISIHPSLIGSKSTGRKLLNDYFELLSAAAALFGCEQQRTYASDPSASIQS